MINEIKGNLFNCPDDNMLAHCVSVDLNMGAGIAKEFKYRFGNVNYLKNQNVQVGECAVLKLEGRAPIFYLVTKEKYYGKPTYESLKHSLISMRNIINTEYKTLSMPLIGCGLDGLDWNIVKNIIIEVFEKIDLEINIYKI